ncbi:MAG: hypothetical protein PVH87_19080 [Desulfobacteraceae bacterium]|jgi:hypothetical protein
MTLMSAKRRQRQPAVSAGPVARAEVTWHQKPKSGPETVKVTVPVKKVTPVKNPTKFTKWDQVVNEKGFMNIYGQTDFENDFNEYSAVIFTYPQMFKKIMNQYPRVRGKFLVEPKSVF